MNVVLLTRRRVDQKMLAFFALLGENLVTIALVATLFGRLFLLRSDFIQATLLPCLGVGTALGCILSAWMARQLSRRNSPAAPCAIPVGPNRWFLVLLCLATWLPGFRELPANLAARQIWELACAWTVMFGVAQLLAALLGNQLRWFLEPASLAGLVASLAMASLLAGPLPAMMENPHIAIPVVGVLLLRGLARLPLPFGLSSPFAALGMGVGVAWLAGSIPGPFPAWTPPMPAPAASSGLLSLWEARASLPAWFWAGLALAGQSAVLDVAQLERASLSGDQYSSKSFLVGLGVVNIVGGLLGSCVPCALLLGHSVYKRLGGGSVYAQGAGLCLLVLSVMGLLPWLLLCIPEAVWAPFVAWLLLTLCSTELAFCTKSSPLGTVCAMLPIFATLLWLQGQGWLLGPDPDLSLLTLKRAVGQPWLHSVGIANLAQGAVATSLLWGSIMVCCQMGMSAYSRPLEVIAEPESEAQVVQPHGLKEAIQRLDKASWLAFLACLLSLCGFIHSPHFGWNPGPLAAAYLMLGVVCHWGYVVELERVGGLPPRELAPPPLLDLETLADSSENPDKSP